MSDNGAFQDIVSGLLQQIDGVPGKQKKCLRPLVAELVANQTPMTAVELAERPALRHISMTTHYRLIAKLYEAGLLRRLSHRSGADKWAIDLPERHCSYLTCNQCGRVVELPRSASLPQMATECTLP